MQSCYSPGCPEHCYFFEQIEESKVRFVMVAFVGVVWLLVEEEEAGLIFDWDKKQKRKWRIEKENSDSCFRSCLRLRCNLDRLCCCCLLRFSILLFADFLLILFVLYCLILVR